jgi:hypothetical protein
VNRDDLVEAGLRATNVIVAIAIVVVFALL